MKYFSPTKTLKELLLLQHIEENPNTTQKGIAQAIGVATSTVWIYRRLRRKQLANKRL